MQTIWLSPTNYVTGDPSLSISYPYVTHPSTVVTSAATGDLKWVFMSLDLPQGATIQQMIVCYQVSNSRSSILQVRLSQMSTPDRALVIHDDATNLQSTSPVCYTSQVGGITVNSGAAVTLELRLNFQDTADHIFLGAVGVVVSDAATLLANRTGELMLCITDGARNAGMLMYVSGETSVNGQTVPVVSAATGMSIFATKIIGILTQTTSGPALAPVRVNGELTEVTINTSGRTVGDRVYVSDSNLSVVGFTSGTYTSVVGYVSVVGAAGRIHVQVDNNVDDSHRINVKAYGAKGDGLTDDTAAIQAAQAAAQNRANAIADIAGSNTSFTAPEIFFPEGIYLLSGPLTPSLTMIGARAILKMSDPTMDILSGFNAGPLVVRGLTFRGGRNQIVINNGDVSDITVFISECEFVAWNGAAIKTIVANSTQIEVSRCHFGRPVSLDPNLCVFNINTCDDFSVHDCWIYAPTNGDCFVLGRGDDTGGPGTGGTAVHVEKIGGVPNGPPTVFPTNSTPSGTAVWFRIYSPSNLWVTEFRFGGEAGARPQLCVETTGTGSSVDFQGNAIFTGVGAGNQYRFNWLFYSMPAYARLIDNYGDGDGLYMDPTISPGDMQAIGNNEFIYDGFRDGMTLGASALVFGSRHRAYAITGMNDMAGRQVLFGTASYRRVRPLQVSDLVRVIPASNTWDGWGGNGWVNTTASFITDIFGKPVVRTLVNVSSPFDNSVVVEANFGWSNALKYLPVGTYTVVLDITVGVHPAEVYIPIGDARRLYDLEPGRHLICVPYNVGSYTASSSIAFQIQALTAGGTIDIGNIRIFSGRVEIETQALELWSPGLPVSGQFWPSDVIRNSVPTPGGSIGWVCTMAGAAYQAQWQSSFLYVFGNQILGHDGNVYMCVAGGTSANTGNGPINSILGQDMNDNGVIWWNVGGPVIFKEFGPISAI